MGCAGKITSRIKRLHNNWRIILFFGCVVKKTSGGKGLAASGCTGYGAGGFAGIYSHSCNKAVSMFHDQMPLLLPSKPRRKR
ncbi:Uncharacterised protein [Neisseria zoodegmatis]|uniref:Uncharacterized protein n=1 Tax=Neisseria zoodegmatis TaxID=326523 RepID=A0A378WGH8_9NEIS|nr:Uncharacterised protein [Neisseria zoodegmatis]